MSAINSVFSAGFAAMVAQLGRAADASDKIEHRPSGSATTPATYLAAIWHQVQESVGYYPDEQVTETRGTIVLDPSVTVTENDVFVIDSALYAVERVLALKPLVRLDLVSVSPTKIGTTTDMQRGG